MLFTGRPLLKDVGPSTSLVPSIGTRPVLPQTKQVSAVIGYPQAGKGVFVILAHSEGHVRRMHAVCAYLTQLPLYTRDAVFRTLAVTRVASKNACHFGENVERT